MGRLACRVPASYLHIAWQLLFSQSKKSRGGKHVYVGQHGCCKSETSTPHVSFRKHSKNTIERVFRAKLSENNIIQQFCLIWTHAFFSICCAMTTRSFSAMLHGLHKWAIFVSFLHHGHNYVRPVVRFVLIFSSALDLTNKIHAYQSVRSLTMHYLKANYLRDR